MNKSVIFIIKNIKSKKEIHFEDFKEAENKFEHLKKKNSKNEYVFICKVH